MAIAEGSSYTSPLGEGVTMSTGQHDFLYGGMKKEDLNEDILNTWLNSVNPTLLENNRDSLAGALYRYSGFNQPERYMSSQRSSDVEMLRNAGLLVNGTLGARSLERRPQDLDLRYNRNYSGLSNENARMLWGHEQDRIYRDLMPQSVAAPGTQSLPTTAPSATYERGVAAQSPSSPAASPAGGQSVREIRRKSRDRSRYSNLGMNRRGLMAGLSPVTQPGTQPGVRYSSPYSETWWEWGNEIAGTDKAGNAWNTADLGIQY